MCSIQFPCCMSPLAPNSHRALYDAAACVVCTQGLCYLADDALLIRGMLMGSGCM